MGVMQTKIKALARLCFFQKALGECLSLFRWLINNRNLFLTVLETGKSKIEVPTDSASGEDLVRNHAPCS